MKKYYGYNNDESRVMYATITGEMCDGAKIYTECDGSGNLVNIDKQYIRTLKHGAQWYFGI